VGERKTCTYNYKSSPANVFYCDRAGPILHTTCAKLYSHKFHICLLILSLTNQLLLFHQHLLVIRCDYAKKLRIYHTIYSHSIVGGTNSALAKFRVDSVSGDVETTGTFDIDGGITYFDLVVMVTDGGTSSLSDTRLLRVGLTDVNDNSPVFSQTVYDVTVTEVSCMCMTSQPQR
jgi:hypothetical protein